MKKFLLALGLAAGVGSGQHAAAQTTIRVIDTALFFDGYAATVSTPPPPPGVLRLRNDLFSRKLTTQELQSIGTKLSMQVVIKAACDNYDRIGNVNLALVPKGAATYKPDSVQRIEIGRYITPFMNKNVQPDTVPYRYNIDNVASLLKETSLTTNYDIWVELQLFGVPYAANTQVSGCSGRNDVFYGSLWFTTNDPAVAQSNNVLLPLSFQKDFNNYQAAATDTVGKTTRTISFTVPANTTDAALFLITSNHGANANGEEYSRRNHFVYFDNALALSYKPGSTSCEPLRKYNTQPNGIYGNSPRSDAQWQSFSNWCPGDTIPIRRIPLGAVAAGTHKFMITVPDAVFTGGQGNFPLSVYFQGKTSGTLAADRTAGSLPALSVYPNPAAQQLTVTNGSADRITGITLCNTVGSVVYRSGPVQTAKLVIPLGDVAPGLYLMHVQTSEGQAVEKVQVIR